jgi:hypothetical protein
MKLQQLDNDAKGSSGHFGFTEIPNQETPLPYAKMQSNTENKEAEYHENAHHFVTSEVTSHHGLTYSDLRKYLWS